MITEKIKANINKIDFDLKNLFENVYITEKSRGNQWYFDISVNSVFNLNESLGNKRVEVKVQISKIDILNDIIRWSYNPNPLNESTEWVERFSTLEKIAEDIHQVVTKFRMEKDYFNKLESQVETINESNIINSKVEKNLVSEIKDSIAEFNIKIDEVEVNQPKNEIESFYSFIESKQDTEMIITHSSLIRRSEAFRLQNKLESLEPVSSVEFIDNKIIVRYS